MGVFDKTIIPLALVGYEMIIANSALRASLANYHLLSNVHLWNNCSVVVTAWHVRRLSKNFPRSFRKMVLFDYHRSNAFKIP